MRVAVIDLGTNTILLLIADIEEDGKLHTLLDTQVVARIGKGIDSNGIINEDSVERCAHFLREYLHTIEGYDVDVILTAGTSAIREAKNRKEFTDHIHQLTDLEIEILSGTEEAHWTYVGAVSGIETDRNHFAVLDIGGGSTEITFGEGLNVSSRVSLDIGCVRLTERFLSHTPPLDSEITALCEYLSENILSFPLLEQMETTFIAVGGTPTTLAAIELGLKEFDRNIVAGYILNTKQVRNRFEQFQKMKPDELHSILRIDPGRADIIFAGVAILRHIMDYYNIETIKVSERGLRYGIAIREWEKSHLRSSIC